MAADVSPGVSQQAAEINAINFKIGADRQASAMAQGAEDNQEDSRAWAQLKLKTATDAQNLANRIASNAATIDHLIDAGVVLAGQVGGTEAQQTVSPAGTAASETTKGAVAAAGAGEAVSAEQVTANVADLASSLIPIIASAVGTVTAQTLAAVLPILVTAIGGASTPSQTKAAS
jgi:hypothetical protein